LLYLSSKIVNKNLLSISYLEYSITHISHLLIRLWRVFRIDASRSPRKYYPLWIKFSDNLRRGIEWQQFAIDICLADPPAYQVAVLGAKIQNHYLVHQISRCS